MGCSTELVAMPNEDNYQILADKHPKAPVLGAPELPTRSPLMVSKDDVSKGIASFPSGSAGGPDFLLPQHLKDMVGTPRVGAEMLARLTTFFNVVLGGGVPDAIRPRFFGATLIALNKRNGGLHPIAVGNTIRHLAVKLASAASIAHISEFF